MLGPCRRRPRAVPLRVRSGRTIWSASWSTPSRRPLASSESRKNQAARAVQTRRGRHEPPLHPDLRTRVRAALGSGPGSGAGRRECRRRAARDHRPGPARRAARVPAVLGRRASQHARHRQLGAPGADRPHRRRDHHLAGRVRRRHAAQPCLPGGRRTVRHAGGAPSRPHRPGHRPRAGHQPGHRGRAAPLARGALGGRLPRSAHGPARVLHRPLARGSPVRPDHRGPRPGPPARHVAARLQRLQRPGGRPARASVRLRAPLQPGQHPPGAGPVP